MSDIGRTTPAGRNISRHTNLDSSARHGYGDNLEKVDDIINNPTFITEQRGGAIVYLQREGDRYNLVLYGEEGVITAMLRETQKQIKAYARNNHWEDLPF